MGQRLNIEIIKNGKVIGNCYYHWSAYTLSSLIETNTVIENYDELLKQNLPDKVLITKMFENCASYDFHTGGFNGAGLSKDSYEYMCNKYPNYEFRKAIDRNAGLIGITEKDIDDTRGWEEGRVTIDLDKEIERVINKWKDFPSSLVHKITIVRSSHRGAVVNESD